MKHRIDFKVMVEEIWSGVLNWIEDIYWELFQ